ncbi:hypothetical protein [Hyphomicrobium sp.]|jgi:hypothetical protein|uniref:hypothetical protein n=1 Tax=Hyphomicrobium sp. TaxID=82 RepID=UPI0035650BE8
MSNSAIELYRGCGFRECGRYQLSRFSRDGRSDEVLMELMRSDYSPVNDIEQERALNASK